jgi:hypothetical protein
MKGSAASFIGGIPDNPVSEVAFRDVELEISGGEHNYSNTPTPIEIWQGANKKYGATAMGMPCALYAENASSVRFDGFRLRRTDRQGLWESALRLRKCRDFDFARTTVEGFDHLSSDAQVRIEESTGIKVGDLVRRSP